MTDDQFAKVLEILDAHHDRMDYGFHAHRDLMARVARCEARLDGRGQEVAERDLGPAEAMDAMSELVREPASPEDTEGLEVVAQMRRGLMGSRQLQDARRPLEEDTRNQWESLVRLSDAVALRQRLTARLEEAERERDAAEAWQEIIGLVKDALALHYGAEHMERVPPMRYNNHHRRSLTMAHAAAAPHMAVEVDRETLAKVYAETFVKDGPHMLGVEALLRRLGLTLTEGDTDD